MGRDTVSSPSGPPARRAPLTYAPYAAFAAFGIFWGTWGATLPALRTQAGASDGQLGAALFCVGLGALPSMALTGRAVDRLGLRIAAWLLSALAAAGLCIAATAHGVGLLITGMLAVGATSGAADVAINTLAGRAEHASAKPLLTRSHGLFSIGVVIASLSAGALLGAGLPLQAVFAVAAAVMIALAALVRLTTTADCGGRTPTGPQPRTRRASPLPIVGLVAALAYAIENGHQSWGAVMLTDILNASPQLAAAAPATFAATAAAARLSLAPLSRSHPTALLLGGGTLAAAGSTVLATAPSPAVALTGLMLAALGTATLFPALLSHSLRGTDPAQHGRATSTVATTAYLGFLLGPAYVGLLADSTDLRGALIGVAALAAVFTATAAPVSAWAARSTSATKTTNEQRGSDL